jgi:hypothetical protein
MVDDPANAENRLLGETPPPVGGSQDGVPATPGPPEGIFPHPLEALIERWWADHFPGSVVARYTECWNYAHSAKEALKALLRRQA